MKRTFLFFIGWLMAFVSYSQDGLNFSVDTNQIRIGEQFRLVLEVVSSSDMPAEIGWPVVLDTITKQIDVVSVSPVDTLPANPGITFLQVWTLTSFDTGFHKVPELAITINGKDFFTDPFFIQVETIPIDTTQTIKAIKGVEGVSISFFDWIKYHWQWFAGLAMLIILLFGLYQLLKRRKAQLPQKVVLQEAKISPWEHAMQRLQKLKEEENWKKDEIKRHHSVLSEIVREYLELEYGFPAMEQTSAEVMESIRYTTIPKDFQKRLERLFVMADLVKFAKEKPTAEQSQESLVHGIEIITHLGKQTEVEPVNKPEHAS